MNGLELTQKKKEEAIQVEEAAMKSEPRSVVWQMSAVGDNTWWWDLPDEVNEELESRTNADVEVQWVYEPPVRYNKGGLVKKPYGSVNMNDFEYGLSCGLPPHYVIIYHLHPYHRKAKNSTNDDEYRMRRILIENQ